MVFYPFIANIFILPIAFYGISLNRKERNVRVMIMVAFK